MRANSIVRWLTGAGMIAMAGNAMAQELPANTPTADAPDEITVLGSRIPRVQKEGPAPVTVVTSEDILKGGFLSVPDVLRSLTQNSG